jgi:hypothetical protein
VAGRLRGKGATSQPSYPGDFRWLLRPGGKAKRKEHSAKHQNRDFLLHGYFPASRHSPLDTRAFSLDDFGRPR